MLRSTDLRGPLVSSTKLDHQHLEIGPNSHPLCKGNNAIGQAMNSKRYLYLEIDEKKATLQI